jgi:hypothetical protein
MWPESRKHARLIGLLARRMTAYIDWDERLSVHPAQRCNVSRDGGDEGEGGGAGGRGWLEYAILDSRLAVDLLIHIPRVTIASAYATRDDRSCCVCRYSRDLWFVVVAPSRRIRAPAISVPG